MLTEIDFKNESGDLRPGMYATAKVGVEKHTGVVLLPVDAVMVEKMGPSIFTMVDGKAKKSPVKTGFNDGTSIEILDGVKENDSVILVGKMTLNNGQAVTVAETK